MSCHHAHSMYSPQYMFAITFCTNFHWSVFVFLSPFTLSELSAILSVLQICFSLYSSYCQLRYGHMSIVFLFLTLYSPIPSDIINLVCIHNIVLPSSLHVFPSIYLCLIVCRSLTLFLLFRPIYKQCPFCREEKPDKAYDRFYTEVIVTQIIQGQA